tara:strand:- start:18311 stop:33826 length:15516 start_codon:yes stop_codon:yes gene_type:complete
MTTFDINLHYGQNLISFPIEPVDNSIEGVFGTDGIISSVITEGAASTFIPAINQWGGSVNNIDYKKGYWVHATEETTLTVTGNLITSNPTYSIHLGANLISFPFLNEVNINQAISDNPNGRISEILGEGVAAVYVNNQWVGSLDTLKPGKGYWIKSSEQFELQISNPNAAVQEQSDYEPPEQNNPYSDYQPPEMTDKNCGEDQFYHYEKDQCLDLFAECPEGLYFNPFAQECVENYGGESSSFSTEDVALTVPFIGFSHDATGNCTPQSINDPNDPCVYYGFTYKDWADCVQGDCSGFNYFNYAQNQMVYHEDIAIECVGLSGGPSVPLGFNDWEHFNKQQCHGFPQHSDYSGTDYREYGCVWDEGLGTPQCLCKNPEQGCIPSPQDIQRNGPWNSSHCSAYINCSAENGYAGDNFCISPFNPISYGGGETYIIYPGEESEAYNWDPTAKGNVDPRYCCAAQNGFGTHEDWEVILCPGEGDPEDLKHRNQFDCNGDSMNSWSDTWPLWNVGNGYGRNRVFQCNYVGAPPEGIEGCTIPWARNYNPNASVDDGSCQLTPFDLKRTYNNSPDWDKAALVKDQSFKDTMLLNNLYNINHYDWYVPGWDNLCGDIVDGSTGNTMEICYWVLHNPPYTGNSSGPELREYNIVGVKPYFIYGDCNGDGFIDMADINEMINHPETGVMGSPGMKMFTQPVETFANWNDWANPSSWEDLWGGAGAGPFFTDENFFTWNPDMYVDEDDAIYNHSWTTYCNSELVECASGGEEIEEKYYNTVEGLRCNVQQKNTSASGGEPVLDVLDLISLIGPLVSGANNNGFLSMGVSFENYFDAEGQNQLNDLNWLLGQCIGRPTVICGGSPFPGEFDMWNWENGPPVHYVEDEYETLFGFPGSGASVCAGLPELPENPDGETLVQWYKNCPISGCQDPTACNYNQNATYEPVDWCKYVVSEFDDNPNHYHKSCGCIQDADNDNHCDNWDVDYCNTAIYNVVVGWALCGFTPEGVQIDTSSPINDPCVGAYDECGVCNGPGRAYSCDGTVPGSENLLCGPFGFVEPTPPQSEGLCDWEVPTYCWSKETVNCYEDEDGDGYYESVVEITECPLYHPTALWYCNTNAILYLSESECISYCGGMGAACSNHPNTYMMCENGGYLGDNFYSEGVLSPGEPEVDGCNDDGTGSNGFNDWDLTRPGSGYPPESPACNYNIEATRNDGSCNYGIVVNLENDEGINRCCTGEEGYFDDTQVLYCCHDDDSDGYCNTPFDFTACSSDLTSTGSCPSSDGESGTYLSQNDAPPSEQWGCTDDAACNFNGYDYDGWEDDGSCFYETTTTCYYQPDSAENYYIMSAPYTACPSVANDPPNCEEITTSNSPYNFLIRDGASNWGDAGNFATLPMGVGGPGDFENLTPDGFDAQNWDSRFGYYCPTSTCSDFGLTNDELCYDDVDLGNTGTGSNFMVRWGCPDDGVQYNNQSTCDNVCQGTCQKVPAKEICESYCGVGSCEQNGHAELVGVDDEEMRLMGFSKAWQFTTLTSGWGGWTTGQLINNSAENSSNGYPIIFGAWVKVRKGTINYGNLNTTNQLIQGPTTSDGLPIGESVDEDASWVWITSSNPNFEHDTNYGSGVHVYACSQSGRCNGNINLDSDGGTDIYNTMLENLSCDSERCFRTEFYVAGLQAIVFPQDFVVPTEQNEYGAYVPLLDIPFLNGGNVQIDPVNSPTSYWRNETFGLTPAIFGCKEGDKCNFRDNEDGGVYSIVPYNTLCYGDGDINCYEDADGDGYYEGEIIPLTFCPRYAYELPICEDYNPDYHDMSYYEILWAEVPGCIDRFITYDYSPQIGACNYYTQNACLYCPNGMCGMQSDGSYCPSEQGLSAAAQCDYIQEDRCFVGLSANGTLDECMSLSDSPFSACDCDDSKRVQYYQDIDQDGYIDFGFMGMPIYCGDPICEGFEDIPTDVNGNPCLSPVDYPTEIPGCTITDGGFNNQAPCNYNPIATEYNITLWPEHECNYGTMDDISNTTCCDGTEDNYSGQNPGNQKVDCCIDDDYDGRCDDEYVFSYCGNDCPGDTLPAGTPGYGYNYILKSDAQLETLGCTDDGTLEGIYLDEWTAQGYGFEYGTKGPACNYNSDATEDDGSCSYNVNCCADSNPTNGFCDYPYVTENKCPFDEGLGEGECPDGWIIAAGDHGETLGCMDEASCNYDASATYEPAGFCRYFVTCCLDNNFNGLCDYPFYEESEFCPGLAPSWPGTYVSYEANAGECPGELLGDGNNWIISTGDYGEIFGCMDSSAVNYDVSATIDEHSTLDNNSPCFNIGDYLCAGNAGGEFTDLVNPDYAIADSIYLSTEYQTNFMIDDLSYNIQCCNDSGDTPLLFVNEHIYNSAYMNNIQMSSWGLIPSYWTSQDGTKYKFGSTSSGALSPPGGHPGLTELFAGWGVSIDYYLPCDCNSDANINGSPVKCWDGMGPIVCNESHCDELFPFNEEEMNINEIFSSPKIPQSEIRKTLTLIGGESTMIQVPLVCEFDDMTDTNYIALEFVDFQDSFYFSPEEVFEYIGIVYQDNQTDELVNVNLMNWGNDLDAYSLDPQTTTNIGTVYVRDKELDKQTNIDGQYQQFPSYRISPNFSSTGALTNLFPGDIANELGNRPRPLVGNDTYTYLEDQMAGYALIGSKWKGAQYTNQKIYGFPDGKFEGQMPSYLVFQLPHPTHTNPTLLEDMGPVSINGYNWDNHYLKLEAKPKPRYGDNFTFRYTCINSYHSWFKDIDVFGFQEYHPWDRTVPLEGLSDGGIFPNQFWIEENTNIHNQIQSARVGKVTISTSYLESQSPEFSIEGVEEVEQTLSSSFDPYSGMYIEIDKFTNDREGFEYSDVDERPSLGVFYYDDDNVSKDNFLIDIPSSYGNFIPYAKTNLINNGDGLSVKQLYQFGGSLAWDNQDLKDLKDVPSDVTSGDIKFGPFGVDFKTGWATPDITDNYIGNWSKTKQEYSVNLRGSSDFEWQGYPKCTDYFASNGSSGYDDWNDRIGTAFGGTMDVKKQKLGCYGDGFWNRVVTDAPEGLDPPNPNNPAESLLTDGASMSRWLGIDYTAEQYGAPGGLHPETWSDVSGFDNHQTRNFHTLRTRYLGQNTAGYKPQSQCTKDYFELDPDKDVNFDLPQITQMQDSKTIWNNGDPTGYFIDFTGYTSLYTQTSCEEVGGTWYSNYEADDTHYMDWWFTYFIAEETGTYTFFVQRDDMLAMSFDGGHTMANSNDGAFNSFVSSTVGGFYGDWQAYHATDSGGFSYYFQIDLEQGEWYPVVVALYEATGDTRLKIKYYLPSEVHTDYNGTCEGTIDIDCIWMGNETAMSFLLDAAPITWNQGNVNVAELNSSTPRGHLMGGGIYTQEEYFNKFVNQEQTEYQIGIGEEPLTLSPTYSESGEKYLQTKGAFEPEGGWGYVNYMGYGETDFPDWVLLDNWSADFPSYHIKITKGDPPYNGGYYNGQEGYYNTLPSDATFFDKCQLALDIGDVYDCESDSLCRANTTYLGGWFNGFTLDTTGTNDTQTLRVKNYEWLAGECCQRIWQTYGNTPPAEWPTGDSYIPWMLPPPCTIPDATKSNQYVPGYGTGNYQYGTARLTNQGSTVNTERFPDFDPETDDNFCEYNYSWSDVPPHPQPDAYGVGHSVGWADILGGAGISGNFVEVSGGNPTERYYSCNSYPAGEAALTRGAWDQITFEEYKSKYNSSLLEAYDVGSPTNQTYPIIYEYNMDEDGYGFTGWFDYDTPIESNLQDVESEEHQWAIWVRSSECRSYNRCLFMATESNTASTDCEGYPCYDDPHNSLYSRLNQYQKIYDSSQPDHNILPYSSLKISFWMKTTNWVDVDIPPEIEVGISAINDPGLAFNDSQDYFYQEDYFNSTYSESTSMGNLKNNLGYMNGKGSYNSTKKTGGWELEPESIFGSYSKFKNTKLNNWEQMEYTVNLTTDNIDVLGNLKDLYFIMQWGNNKPGSIYIDDIKITEAYDFIPDVDVRAKLGPNTYGTGVLTEYYDKQLQPNRYQSTIAPLEASFYFYPRYPHKDIFDMDKDIMYNDYTTGFFYLYDVDWGDGSPNEFIPEPKQLGNNTAVTHTYENSGIYEITGYMLRVKPDSLTNYTNLLGVIHNVKFTTRININEGTDEEFVYGGNTDGFSFIPYKETSPIIGGISKQSSYYKSIQRQLGFISEETRISTVFDNTSDKLKTELALLKMDNSYENKLEIAPSFQIPRYSIPSLGENLYNPIEDFNEWQNAGHFDVIDQSISGQITLTSNQEINIGTYAFSSIGVDLYKDGQNIYIDHSKRYKVSCQVQVDSIDTGWVAIYLGASDGGYTESDIKFTISEPGEHYVEFETELTAYDNHESYTLDFCTQSHSSTTATWTVSDIIVKEITENIEDDLIYTGVTPIKAELGDSLGDSDLTNIRYFNQPKYMWEMLGFSNPFDASESWDYLAGTNIVSNSTMKNDDLYNSDNLENLLFQDPSYPGDIQYYYNGEGYGYLGGGFSTWDEMGVRDGEWITLSGEMKVSEDRAEYRCSGNDSYSCNTCYTTSDCPNPYHATNNPGGERCTIGHSKAYLYTVSDTDNWITSGNEDGSSAITPNISPTEWTPFQISLQRNDDYLLMHPNHYGVCSGDGTTACCPDDTVAAGITCGGTLDTDYFTCPDGETCNQGTPEFRWRLYHFPSYNNCGTSYMRNLRLYKTYLGQSSGDMYDDGIADDWQNWSINSDLNSNTSNDNAGDIPTAATYTIHYYDDILGKPGWAQRITDTVDFKDFRAKGIHYSSNNVSDLLNFNGYEFGKRYRVSFDARSSVDNMSVMLATHYNSAGNIAQYGQCQPTDVGDALGTDCSDISLQESKNLCNSTEYCEYVDNWGSNLYNIVGPIDSTLGKATIYEDWNHYSVDFEPDAYSIAYFPTGLISISPDGDYSLNWGRYTCRKWINYNDSKWLLGQNLVSSGDAEDMGVVCGKTPCSSDNPWVGEDWCDDTLGGTYNYDNLGGCCNNGYNNSNVGTYNSNTDGPHYASNNWFEITNVQIREVSTIGNYEFETIEDARNALAQIHPGSPISEKYWKNILPEEYDILYDRDGINQGEYINTMSEQEWPENYYYPVLPKYDRLGNFIDENYPFDRIPFPENGIITNENYSDSSLLINIVGREVETNVIEDASGNDNIGFAFSDYKPEFDEETNKPKKIKHMNKIKSSKLDGAF